MRFDNLTFVIPCKLDSLFRLENLLVVIDCYSKTCKQIVVCEVGRYNSHILERLLIKKRNVCYH